MEYCWSVTFIQGAYSKNVIADAYTNGLKVEPNLSLLSGYGQT